MDVTREVNAAAASGNMDMLKTLIQNDPLLLVRVSLTSFEETPLHIATLRRDMRFVCELLIHRGGPVLATKLDLQRRSPLHLASAMGHVDILEHLLPHVSLQDCLARDQDGRNPLQLAALHSQIEAIEVLIQKQPQLVKEKLDHEQTILHFCVAYNRLEALVFLIDTGAADDELLTSKDSDGNTILHLATILKHVKITTYLLSVNSIKESANCVNGKGLTALDVMGLFPRAYKTLEIEEVLRAKDLQTVPTEASSSLLTVVSINAEPPPVNVTSVSRCPTIFSRFVAKVSSICIGYDLMKNDVKWLEESRGYLVVGSTLTATMAFQAGINPPGGAWQDTVTQGPDPSMFHYAGTSILASTDGSRFKYFFAFNTLSLLSSLTILIWMILGFPVKKKIYMELFTLNMIGSVMLIAVTYISAAMMLIPDAILKDSLTSPLLAYSYLWFLVVSFFIFMLIFIFFKRVVSYLYLPHLYSNP